MSSTHLSDTIQAFQVSSFLFSFNSKFSPIFFSNFVIFRNRGFENQQKKQFYLCFMCFRGEICLKMVVFQKPGETWWVFKYHQVFTLNITKFFKILVKIWWFFLKILLWCACILFVENFETCVLDSRIYLQKVCWVLELKLLGEKTSSALSLTPKQLNICNVCTFRSARKFRGVCSVPSGPAIRRQEVPTNCQETRLGWKRKENH